MVVVVVVCEGEGNNAGSWWLVEEGMFVDGQVVVLMIGNRLGGSRTPLCIAFYWRKKLDPLHAV